MDRQSVGYSAMKKNKLQMHALAWINPKTLFAVKESRHIVLFHLYKMSRKDKSIATVNQWLPGARNRINYKWA